MPHEKIHSLGKIGTITKSDVVLPLDSHASNMLTRPDLKTHGTRSAKCDWS